MNNLQLEDQKIIFFTSNVISTLAYGCEIWKPIRGIGRCLNAFKSEGLEKY